MGLDVYAYKNIKKSDVELNEDGYAIDPETGEEIACGKYFSAWINPDFPGRADDIEDSSVYTYEDSTSLSVGCGGHFWWRDELAKLAGYPLAELDMGYRKEMNHFAGACKSDGGAFYELINFSDSEGVIGTAVSKKLAADFSSFDEEAKKIGEGFLSLYQQWKVIFEMASEGGCVRFW